MDPGRTTEVLMEEVVVRGDAARCHAVSAE
eukprot:COSAG01_NODE_11039_length_2022_cov_2.541862_2_plen_29_part_01